MTTSSVGELALQFVTSGGRENRRIVIDQITIASWTGRDPTLMERRLTELEELGIPRPPSLPMLYRVAAARATTAGMIEVLGERTSGEVEFLLLKTPDRIWVGVGSDHTDRAIETQDAALSKQACDKPICSEFWPLDEVEGHWDALRLRSVLTSHDGQPEVYQEGSVNAMIAPRELLRLWESADPTTGVKLLFCGTLASIGSIRSATTFQVELEDAVLGRRLSHRYNVLTMPPCLTVASSRVQQAEHRER